MRNFSEKRYRENQNAHLMLHKVLSENRAVCEITWKNSVQPDRPQIGRTRLACWITNATNTRLEYAITVTFPLQQLLQERASTLPDTYITCLVHSNTKKHFKLVLHSNTHTESVICCLKCGLIEYFLQM